MPALTSARQVSGRHCSSSSARAAARVAPAAASAHRPRRSGMPARRNGAAPMGALCRGRSTAIHAQAMGGSIDGDELADDGLFKSDDDDEDEEVVEDWVVDPDINETNFPPHFIKALRAMREVPEVLPHQEWIRDGSQFNGPPAHEPFEEAQEPDALGKKAQEFKEDMRQREWQEFLDKCDKVGEFKSLDISGDSRLKKPYKRKEWTHQEIVDFIDYGDTNDQVIIQPITWRADYQHLHAYIPTTEEFLETQGRFFPEAEAEEEGLLDSDFDSDFEGDLTNKEDATDGDGDTDSGDNDTTASSEEENDGDGSY